MGIPKPDRPDEFPYYLPQDIHGPQGAPGFTGKQCSNGPQGIQGVDGVTDSRNTPYGVDSPDFIHPEYYLNQIKTKNNMQKIYYDLGKKSEKEIREELRKTEKEKLVFEKKQKRQDCTATMSIVFIVTLVFFILTLLALAL